MSRRHRRLLLAALTAALTAPTAAHAGTYEVLSCGAASGINNAWTPLASSDAITAVDACANPGLTSNDDFFNKLAGSLGVFTRTGAPTPPVGSYGFWRFEVPDPLRITASRLVGHSHSESDGWRLVAEADYGELSHCQINEPGSGINDHCDTGGGAYGQNLPTTSEQEPQPQRWVQIGFRCTVAPCDTGVTLHNAAVAIYSAGETISDPVAPAAVLSGVPSQTAIGGAITASVAGSDQTGISALQLVVDGGVAASSSRACDFTRVLPCESPGGSVSVSLSATLAPGVHQVAARSVDAAGNATTSAAQPVSVPAPPPPATTPVTPPTTTPAPGPGQTPGPGPGGPTPGAKTKVALKVSSVSRSGSKVRVRGRVAVSCRSRLTITLEVGSRERTAHLTAPRSGKWGVTVAGVARRGVVHVRVSAKAAACTAAAVRARHK